MIILDKPTSFDGSTIELPLYHRGHSSLFPGAKVWLCLIPRTIKSPFPELVVSPIHYDAWSDLWRISITLRERVGLVHDFFQILADNSINIITAESASRDRMSLHSIEVIASAQLYNSPFNDLTHEERSTVELEDLFDLRMQILARLIDDIAFLPNGQPRLRIRRVRNLLHARKYYNSAQSGYHLKLNQSPVVRETIVERIGKNKIIISLPREIQHALLEEMPPSTNNGIESRGKHLILSNTSERFLHVIFMRDEDFIIAPTIEHLDELGALAKISAAIQGADFNILTTLSRLYRWESVARTEFVLRPPATYTGRLSETTIKKKLEEALSTPELDKRYQIKVGYPVNYITPVETKRLTALIEADEEGQATSTSDKEQPETRSIETIISSKLREYTRLTKLPKASTDAVMRFQLLENLAASRSATAIYNRSGSRGVLFISYAFQDPDSNLIHLVTKMAKKHHFEVRTAKKLGSANTTREGIIELMSNCTHFLGIWTEAGGSETEGGYMPSPWLHWEWGVADALGLTWHLLISNNISKQSWQRIAGETPHSIFSTSDFNEKLKDAIESL